MGNFITMIFLRLPPQGLTASTMSFPQDKVHLKDTALRHPYNQIRSGTPPSSQQTLQ